MNVIQALILGIVQGLGEFLPVSSSGHLVLLQKVFGINEGAMTFDIVVHLGTLVSLCVVMRRRLLAYLRDPFGYVPRMVVLGTVPTVLIVLAFNSFFEEMFASGSCLGFGFIFTALLLWFAEHNARRDTRRRGASGGRWEAGRGGRGGWRAVGGGSAGDGKKRQGIESEISVKGALLVGVAQGIAVTPAVSRSGSTIAGGLISGFSREASIEFAFLMSIPVTLLAVAQDVLKMFMGGGGEAAVAATSAGAAAGAAVATQVGAVAMLIGAVAAMVTGYFAARFMLTAIRRIRLTWFSLYVGLLGALILADQLVFGVVFDKFF